MFNLTGTRPFLLLLAPDTGTGSAGGAATPDTGAEAAATTPDAAPPTGTQAGPDKVTETTPPPLEKTFTHADVDAIIAKRLAKEQKDITAKLAAARAEGEKVATMTAEEKAKHAREQAEAALAAREAEITRRELRTQALQTLGEKGLPRELAEIADTSDPEKLTASLTAIETVFRAAVEAGVADRLKGAPPKTSAAAPDSAAISAIFGNTATK
jgi:flagellar biosynthesis GTPase FlhF